MDLFERASNATAVLMYQRLGYVVFRRVIDYYGPPAQSDGAEDAFNMRKARAQSVAQG